MSNLDNLALWINRIQACSSYEKSRFSSSQIHSFVSHFFMQNAVHRHNRAEQVMPSLSGVFDFALFLASTTHNILL